jgi:two-component system sensor histidine kinase PilS (NtrC family)
MIWPSPRDPGPAPRARDRDCLFARSFLIYRLFIAAVFLALFYFGFESSFLGSYTSRFYQWTAWSYLGAVLIGFVIYWRYSGSCEHQAYLMVFLDIPVLVMLAHSSGGIVSGITMLLAVSIAFGGAVMRGRAVLVFSAIASLAVLTAEIYADLRGSFAKTHYTQAGLMGLSFFAMALLAEALSSRLRETERLVSRREVDLADMAQLNQYIIQHIDTGIIVVDLEAKVRLFNEAAFRLLGMPEISNGQPLERFSQELAEGFASWSGGQEFTTQPFSPRGAAHQLRARMVRVGRKVPSGFLIFVDNVSELAERAHQMKLASLGQLVASIAHEVRNPLGAISHAEQLLGESPNLDEGDRRLMAIIQRHSMRVNGIVEDMLSLSRRDAAKPQTIELNEWLADFVTDCQQQCHLADASLALHCYDTDIRVVVDPGHLRQILDNLINNSQTHFDREPDQLGISLVAGISTRFGNSFVEVLDNGPGIGTEQLERIFEPFYTTSSMGTGLGLFITKELCEANRIRLEYRGNPGARGGRFRVIFPNLTLGRDGYGDE